VTSLVTSRRVARARWSPTARNGSCGRRPKGPAAQWPIAHTIGVSWLLSAAFTITWVVTAVGGGWLATLDQEQREGGWGFPLYFTAIVVIVAVFMAGLYAVSTDVGRRHIRGGTWMVTTIRAMLFVAHLGQFGPLDSPVLANPIDLIVMIGIALGSFVWSVRAGGPTEELGDILAAQQTRTRAEAS
jgi:hypothetical protein